VNCNNTYEKKYYNTNMYFYSAILRFLLELAAAACVNCMCCGLEGRKWGGGAGGGEGNPEHTVVPNVALWNVGFQE
jgi:hypothetical protein